MVTGLYLATFLSSLCILITILTKYKRITTIMVLFPIVTTIQSLGRVIVAYSNDLPLSLFGNLFIHLGGCFSPLVVIFVLIQLCKINIPKIILRLLTIFTSFVFSLAFTIEWSDIYYKSITIAKNENFYYLIKDYGPFHILMTILILIDFLMIILCLIIAVRQYKKVSLKTIKPIIVLTSIVITSYILERLLKSKISYLSIGYFLAMLFCIKFLKNINMLDMTTNIASCIEKRNINGYIQFNEKLCCAGYNEKFLELFPEIESKWNIDDEIPPDNSFLYTQLIQWFLNNRNSKDKKKTIKLRDKYYELSINTISYENKKCVGYIIELFDRTAENKYLETVKNYNENLKKEVYKKTKDILQINDAFGKVVDPEVRDYILGGHVSLGGETIDVSVMFCDIRSFTSLSESMPPEKVVSLLNFYFTSLGKCISNHNGIVNKYIGDAIMAIFGAPVPSKNNAMDAYKAALDMREALKQINEHLKEKGYPEVHFGIGIHTGPVLAGNIGATNRMEYTVIGDTVNTASRIESLCKTYKTDLLITESTANNLGNIKDSLHLVDIAQIRGKEEKVKLYN